MLFKQAKSPQIKSDRAAERRLHMDETGRYDCTHRTVQTWLPWHVLARAPEQRCVVCSCDGLLLVCFCARVFIFVSFYASQFDSNPHPFSWAVVLLVCVRCVLLVVFMDAEPLQNRMDLFGTVEIISFLFLTHCTSFRSVLYIGARSWCLLKYLQYLILKIAQNVATRFIIKGGKTWTRIYPFRSQWSETLNKNSHKSTPKVKRNAFECTKHLFRCHKSSGR